MYNGEVVHFIGGAQQYIGKIDQGEHPNGPGWWRIKDPCVTFQEKDQQTQKINNVVFSMAGPNKIYRKFVDVFIPSESIIEIKVLDKNGQLYKVYKEEANRVAPSRIVLPDSGIKAV